MDDDNILGGGGTHAWKISTAPGWIFENTLNFVQYW